MRQTFSNERGQTTAEYALVLLVVAVVVGVFAAFVRGGGLDGFFQAIVDQLPSSIG
jgi:Flp pilus assembly pilin Flp